MSFPLNDFIAYSLFSHSKPLTAVQLFLSFMRFVSNINYVCAMETVRGRSRSKQLPFCSTSFSGHFLSKRGRYFSRSLLLSLDGRLSVSIVTTMVSVTHGFDFQLIKRQKLRQNVIEYFHFMNEMSSSIN